MKSRWGDKHCRQEKLQVAQGIDAAFVCGMNETEV